ncbi:hypothetical protein BB560_003270 [Smittium megazygosporum]|uniref:Uncharacterized protein n=1 Tax=Smittium megazygosporum TaxID=133381 RepID=A0A2T9ZCK7_9FUNG|nr:hypothetical protein BB560_003270 [Smittium megazygosporum]
MIRIINKQQKIWFPRRYFRHKLREILTIGGYAGWDVGLIITDNINIRKLNKTYRGIDRATDVLSFPSTQVSPQNLLYNQVDSAFEPKDLGDIVLSLEYCCTYSKKHQQNVLDTTIILLIHSFCHLLGHDHDLDQDYIKMRRKEDEILGKLKP